VSTGGTDCSKATGVHSAHRPADDNVLTHHDAGGFSENDEKLLTLLCCHAANFVHQVEQSE
jgi:hypothetical protein